jgi:hypothetical protein
MWRFCALDMQNCVACQHRMEGETNRRNHLKSKREWWWSMKHEIKSHVEHGSHELVDRPSPVLQGLWTYKRKQSGMTKSRYCARGDQQEFPRDHQETTSNQPYCGWGKPLVPECHVDPIPRKKKRHLEVLKRKHLEVAKAR